MDDFARRRQFFRLQSLNDSNNSLLYQRRHAEQKTPQPVERPLYPPDGRQRPLTSYDNTSETDDCR